MVNHLRRFLNHRISKKVIAPIDFTEWENVGEDSNAVYLPWEEIEKIYTVDLSGHPHFISYRNNFVLGCLTGLRFSDFSELEMPDVRGDYLYKKQFKSYHRVVIPSFNSKSIKESVIVLSFVEWLIKISWCVNEGIKLFWLS